MTHSHTKTFADRAPRHGDWPDNAWISQRLQEVARDNPASNWSTLPDWACEGITAICQKMARILAGDPLFADHWHDIAGYAMRCEEQCPVATPPAADDSPEVGPEWLIQGKRVLRLRNDTIVETFHACVGCSDVLLCASNGFCQKGTTGYERHRPVGAGAPTQR